MDVITAVTLYKIASLLCGAVLCYLGYRLFCRGIWGESGNLEARLGDNRLVLKSAAPGTFFVVLGTVVILMTVFKGLELESRELPALGSSELPQGGEKTNRALGL